MGLASRAAFTALPLAALGVVVGMLLWLQLPTGGALEWIPALGISLAWRIDGLAVLMLLMITAVGSAVFVYAGGYFASHPGQRRLFVQLTLFMVAMIGCVTADNLFTLFLFWEATSVLSFLLVGFHHERAVSRKAAQQALLVTGTGGLALLAGLILIGQVMGTSTISVIVERLPATAPTPLLTAGVLLVIVGAFTKSAQFPFHFWLPNAMAAPTPVSAYLHSATMVKLGVYLLARLDAGLDDWLLWQVLLQGAGSITAAWGMVLALRERDLKRILAWSTVATLGTLVALVGMPGEGAAVAVGALLLAHALYKAPLLATVGALAGFFVVPMNALLQHRGQQLLGAGESIAVQNFNENLSVLAMLGAYAALQMTGWPLHRTVFALGSVVALGVLSVMWRYRLVGARRQLLEREQT